MRPWTALAFCLTLISTHAQITPVGNLTTYAYLTHTMRSAGPLIYTSTGPGAFVLYNLDLSVYLNITLPPLQAPYTIASPSYFSEDLFDSDPSTVEYLLWESYYDDETGQGGSKTSIMRVDGTVLWSEEGLEPAFSAAASQPVIFNTPSGTLMNLRDSDHDWNLFSLPGTLPCVECGDIGTGMAPQGEGERSMITFPNPTSGLATIQYTIPGGTQRSALVFFDTHGRLVKRFDVNASGTKTITTQDLASGTYLFRLELDGKLSGAERLVVVK